MTLATEHDSVEVVVERVRLRRLPPPAERRRLRKAVDGTLQDIADATGASQASASLWERGIHTPGPRYFRSYLRLLAAWTVLEQELEPVETKVVAA